MALFYVIEFPNEENHKSRGPFLISSSRIRKSEDTGNSSELGTVEVKWDVVDSFGNLKEEYYDGVCLMKGTKKDCGLFVDRLKVNREQAEINNKEGRTRKKPTKLLDYAADPVEEVNSNPAKITERVKEKPSPGEDTSDSEGKHDIIRSRKELTVQKQDKGFPAGAQKPPRNCKRSFIPGSDSEESFSGETRSVSSSDEAEYKSPKTKIEKLKKLKSTEQQPPVKKKKNASKVKKLRQKTQKKLIEENADLQSAAIGEELSERLKMKVRRFSGSESIEFELTVDRDMTLADLRKTMSSATGIRSADLRMIIRGQPCELQAQTVKLDEIWSPKDIVGVVSNFSERRRQPDPDDGSGPISPVAPILPKAALEESQSDTPSSNCGSSHEDGDGYVSTENDLIMADDKSFEVETTSSLVSGMPTKLNPESADMSQQLQLSAQLKGLTNQISRIERLLDSFTNCKACIKKAYKGCATSTVSSPVQNNAPPEPVINLLINDGPKSCPKALEPTKTKAPGNFESGPSSHPVDPNDNIMVGNPQHGIYVSKARMDKIPSEKAKNYALKLFEILFSREEAGTSSIEGKGDKLKKLDLNRMDALRECTKKQFPTETIKWAEIEASINCKCRMVRNGRCLTWA